MRKSRSQVQLLSAVPIQFGAGLKAGRETLILEVVVRVHGADPNTGPTIGAVDLDTQRCTKDQSAPTVHKTDAMRADWVATLV